MSQIDLFTFDRQTPCPTRIVALADMLRSAYGTGHICEGEYDQPSSWPTLFLHRKFGGCLLWRQRDAVWSPMLFRVVFTDARGYVVDESSWVSTAGGARGYANRARLAPGTNVRYGGKVWSAL